jgi:sarcosine oxidase
LQAQPYAETTCLFTSTPDQRFLLDRADGITVVSSCSGHGAKFAPLIGMMAADLAETSTGPATDAAVPLEFRVQPTLRPAVAQRTKALEPAGAWA